MDEEEVQKAKRAIELLASLTAASEVERPTTSHASGPSSESPQHGAGDVMSAASKCILALDSTKKRRRTQDEVRLLFRKKGKQMAWKHRFFCLADKMQTRVPTTEQEKEVLYRAGLGEKEVEFDDIKMNSAQFKEVLSSYYPQLKNCGGIQFLKCSPNSRNLEVLASTTLLSPESLKNRVGSSRTYIRPLQVNLDTSVVPSAIEFTDISEMCLKCGLSFQIDDISAHLELCKAGTSDNVMTPYNWSSDDELPDLPPFSSTTALKKKSVSPGGTSACDERKYSINDYLEELKFKITEETVNIYIRRGFILNDTLQELKKPKFSPEKKLRVKFIGESAVDTGGPTREFFSLLVLQIRDTYFFGEENCKFIRNDMLAVQNQDYFFLGMLCVLSIIYGGSGFPFMCQQMFDYIVHGSYNMTSMEPTNIPDYELRCLTKKIKDATSDQELQAVLSDEISMLTDTGYRKPIANVTVDDKSELVSVITEFHLMAKCKMELDQFCEGLKVFEFLDLLKINPSLWKCYFVHDSNTTLTSAGSCSCTLEDVLQFCTGNRVLSLGVSPKVKFREGQLATSSTCAMEIHLPLNHSHYISFKEAMVLAIKGNDGFGKC